MSSNVQVPELSTAIAVAPAGCLLIPARDQQSPASDHVETAPHRPACVRRGSLLGPPPKIIRMSDVTKGAALDQIWTLLQAHRSESRRFEEIRYGSDRLLVSINPDREFARAENLSNRWNLDEESKKGGRISHVSLDD